MMSRRKKKTQPVTPEAQQPVQAPVEPPASPQPVDNTALLDRLAALEKAMEGEEVGPVAQHRRQLAAEHARTHRPAGPAPEKATHCPYCGTPDSATGWRLLEVIPGNAYQEGVYNGWACTPCANVAQPPYVNGSRTIPNSYDLRSLLISTHFDIPPLRWLAHFGGRHKLTWEYATKPGIGPWSHVPDLDQWEHVAKLAERRHEAGVGGAAPIDWEWWWKRETVLVRKMQYDDTFNMYRPMPSYEPAPLPDSDTPEQLASEEQLVEELLKAKRRKEKEDEAAASADAARQARADEVRQHYLEHRKMLDEQYKAGRAELRAQYLAVLEHEGLTP
ncbi:hypothetical protein [Streptomyces hydrogenans]|uniref:hypothetical protein n=1 Tax=Streptomyces hydrogenans TaxID=1873719 RepID=UPI0037F18C30